MKIIKNDRPIPFDVDNTLVEWVQNYDKKQKGLQEFDYGDKKIWLKPIQSHIDFLKFSKKRGNFIIVWSMQGYAWCEEVIKKLKLEPYVDLILTKPFEYVDDLKCDEWLINRIYFHKIGR